MTSLTEQVARAIAITMALSRSHPATPDELAEAAIKAMEQHSKPKWEDAPEWAQWLSQDASTAWRWHECKPKARHGIYHWISGMGRWEWAGGSNPHWMDTLEGNPATAASISTLEPRNGQ